MMTRDQVIAELGPVDDGVVAEIIGLNPAPAELAEARGWMAAGDVFMDGGRPLPGGRVGRVIRILQRLEHEAEAILEGR
jgi:hypothetical protein